MKGVGILVLVGAFLSPTFYIAEGKKLEIKLSARGLPNMDIFDGAPDPYAILHYSYDPSEDFFQVGQTRYFDDVNEAKWPEAFEFTYAGVNSKQRIKIDVMDSDVNEDDKIGTVELTLKEVANSFGLTLEVPIIPFGNGNVTVTGKFLE